MNAGQVERSRGETFCASSIAAQLLPDEEFWARVFMGEGLGPGTDESWDEWEPPSYQSTPCRVCGETGPCGYDEQGRVLIHATEAEDG